MTTRAINIELASSLTTISAIMAIKRFMARRGISLFIYFDNGTNFKGMSKELSRDIKKIDDDMMRDLAL